MLEDIAAVCDVEALRCEWQPMRIAAHESSSRGHLRTRELLARSFEANHRGIWSSFGDACGEDSESAADFEDQARGSCIKESYKLFVGEMIERREAVLLARAGAVDVPRARLSAF